MRIASGGTAPATGVPAARVMASWATVRVSRSTMGAMSGANWCGETSAMSDIVGFLRLLGDDREPGNECVRLGDVTVICDMTGRPHPDIVATAWFMACEGVANARRPDLLVADILMPPNHMHDASKRSAPYVRPGRKAPTCCCPSTSRRPP